MEPVWSWSPGRVRAWISGLDAPLEQYLLSEWELSGVNLLQLSSEDLEKLGVHKIGHQELILEAVEKLCSLTYGLGGEKLGVLTEKLHGLALSLQKGIQGRWQSPGYDSQTSSKLPAAELQVVLDVITSSKDLFSLLNRYQFFQLSGYTTSRSIIAHCQELGHIVHQDTTVYEKEKDIVSVCHQLVAACDEILSSSPSAALTHAAQLESVDLVPASPGDQLCVHIASTGSSNHYVTGSVAESAADFCDKILAGDEVIQVNEQIVVGWSRENLVKKLQENPNGVTLVLKKVPGSLRRKNTDQGPPPAQEEEEEEEEEVQDKEEEEEEGQNPRHSIFERVAASVRSLSFRKAIRGPETAQQPMGQEESELSSDRGLEGRLTVTSSYDRQGLLLPLSAAGDCEGHGGLRLSPEPWRDGSLSPRSPRNRSPQGRASVSSCPEIVGQRENKDTKKSFSKGMTSALSRRRVSCRELGRPDCDGWLWKKRKESNVFIAQKWQRFWFVLKGPSLYWYTSQQDEKAEGLVQIASYSIESAGEHKRKFVFQMCHQRFQTFFFAAENVNDMGKWLNALIPAIQKHKKFHTDPPDSEEECYSETESEDEGSPSQRRRNKKVQSNTLPRPKGKKTKVPLSNTPLESSKVTGGQVDEMGVMLKGLKEGGVSLIGHNQPSTQDQFRKSFIRRNKNPVINEKAHTLRALHSTLKAKEAELLQINSILEDSELTAGKFRCWKENHEELCLEIEKLAQLRASKHQHQHQDQDPVTEETAPEAATPAQDSGKRDEAVAAETVAPETAGACRLSLSDGEQLVDAELSDVFLQILPSPSPVAELDLSLGSLRDSINRQLDEMASDPSGGEAAGDYFYI